MPCFAWCPDTSHGIVCLLLSAQITGKRLSQFITRLDRVETCIERFWEALEANYQWQWLPWIKLIAASGLASTASPRPWLTPSKSGTTFSTSHNNLPARIHEPISNSAVHVIVSASIPYVFQHSCTWCLVILKTRNTLLDNCRILDNVNLGFKIQSVNARYNILMGLQFQSFSSLYKSFNTLLLKQSVMNYMDLSHN